MRGIIFGVLIVCSGLWANDFAIQKLFELHNAKGTMIIESLNSQKSYIHNPQRASSKLLPASTFKIPHTLIALDQNLVENKNSVMSWDGKKRELDAWNHDQTLNSAFKASCVWCYQTFAKVLNKQIYAKYLKDMHYGNEKVGQNIETFWLNGDIRITAHEQIAFLKKLYNNALPFKQQDINTLKSIMLSKETSAYKLYSKTGWATSVEPSHGWYVGYVQTSNDVWFFATNMVIYSRNDLVLRKKITLEALKVLEII